MAPSIGVNIRVTGHCNQGGRKYMEDAFAVAYQQSDDELDLEYAFFGIFDGHGGREAALFAKENLMNFIVGQKNFWSDKDENVLKAIKEGFLATHMAMWKQVGTWPQTVSGLPSTSGTTASVVFIRKGKMYVGHVGDSAIVLGYKEPDSPHYSAQPLTCDHKPESPAERKRIENVGGCVMNKCGVQRVVWNRPRIGHKGPIRRSTHIDHIPFLAVARSLGDLWSYDYFHGQFIVSPEPDVSVVTIDPKRDRCIVLATDGVWNMVSSREAVRVVEAAEYENERRFLIDETRQIGCKPWVNPSKLLVNRALELWNTRRKRADNTTVVIVMLDPPGPPKSEVLLRRRMLQRLRPRDEPAEGTGMAHAEARSRLMMTRPPPLLPPSPHHMGMVGPPFSSQPHRSDGAIPPEYRPPLPPKTRHPVASGLAFPLSPRPSDHRQSDADVPLDPALRTFFPLPPKSCWGYDEATLRSSRTPPLIPVPTNEGGATPEREEESRQHLKPVPLHRTSRWGPPPSHPPELPESFPSISDPYFYVRGQRVPPGRDLGYAGTPPPQQRETTLRSLPGGDATLRAPTMPSLDPEDHRHRRPHHHHHHHHRLHHHYQHHHHSSQKAEAVLVEAGHGSSYEHEASPHRTPQGSTPETPPPLPPALDDVSTNRDSRRDSEVVASATLAPVDSAHHVRLASAGLKRKLPPGARELFTLVSKHSRLNQYGRGPTPSSLLSMCALAAEAGRHATRSSKVRLLRKAPSL